MKNPAAETCSKTLVAVLAELLAGMPQLAEVQVAGLRYPPPLQERVGDVAPRVHRRILEVAEERRQYGGSFWDRLLERTVEEDMELPTALLAAAEYHQSFADAVWSEWIKNDSRLRAALEQVTDAPAEQSLVVIRSKVRLKDRTVAHLPMLDFRLRSSPSHHLPASQLAQWLLPGSCLIDSGSSYHVYGRQLMSDSDLASFLGRALQFSPLVDRRWIAHQLREGCCALRIGRGAGHNFPPTLPMPLSS
jgi:hypothetical protein